MFNHQVFDLIRTKLAGLWTNDLKQTAVYGPRRPTGAALRNPADPIQAARIEAAAVKRARRADKLHHQAHKSMVRNLTIVALGRYGAVEQFRKNLSPFYVAK